MVWVMNAVAAVSRLTVEVFGVCEVLMSFFEREVISGLVTVLLPTLPAAAPVGE